MPQGLLLLPLLGGFALLHLSHYFRFRAQRFDGYRLLLASAMAGAFLLLAARMLVLGFGLVPCVGEAAGRIWHTLCPFPHSDTCALAMLLGLAGALLANLIWNEEEAKNLHIEKKKRADALTRLLYFASQNNRLISVTLTSRKWYVGFVAEVPNLAPEEKYFRLLPFYSGYRDEKTLETERTVFYAAIDAANSADYVITIPIADVKTANLFDPDAYEEHFAGEAPGEPPGVAVDPSPPAV